MKRLKKVLILICIIAIISSVVFSNDKNIQSKNLNVVTNTYQGFERISKDEYFQIKEQQKNIFSSEVNEKESNLENGNGVTYIYGYMYFIDSYKNKIKIRSQVPVIIAINYYGKMFVEVLESQAETFKVSSGSWTFKNSYTTAYIDPTNTKTRVQYSGIMEVKESDIIKKIEEFEIFKGLDLNYYYRNYVNNFNTGILKNNN